MNLNIQHSRTTIGILAGALQIANCLGDPGTSIAKNPMAFVNDVFGDARTAEWETFYERRVKAGRAGQVLLALKLMVSSVKIWTMVRDQVIGAEAFGYELYPLNASQVVVGLAAPRPPVVASTPTPSITTTSTTETPIASASGQDCLVRGRLEIEPTEWIWRLQLYVEPKCPEAQELFGAYLANPAGRLRDGWT